MLLRTNWMDWSVPHSVHSSLSQETHPPTCRHTHHHTRALQLHNKPNYNINLFTYELIIFSWFSSAFLFVWSLFCFSLFVLVLAPPGFFLFFHLSGLVWVWFSFSSLVVSVCMLITCDFYTRYLLHVYLPLLCCSSWGFFLFFPQSKEFLLIQIRGLRTTVICVSSNINKIFLIYYSKTKNF